MIKQIFIFLVTILVLLMIALVAVSNNVFTGSIKYLSSPGNSFSADLKSYSVPFPKAIMDTSGYDTYSVATTVGYGITYEEYSAWLETKYDNHHKTDNRYDKCRDDHHENNHDESSHHH